MPTLKRGILCRLGIIALIVVLTAYAQTGSMAGTIVDASGAGFERNARGRTHYPIRGSGWHVARGDHRVRSANQRRGRLPANSGSAADYTRSVPAGVAVARVSSG